MLIFPDLAVLDVLAAELDPMDRDPAILQRMRQGQQLILPDSQRIVELIADDRWWIHRDPLPTDINPTPFDCQLILAPCDPKHTWEPIPWKRPVEKHLVRVRRDLLLAMDHTQRFLSEGMPVLQAVIWAAYPDRPVRLCFRAGLPFVNLSEASARVRMLERALGRALRPWKRVLIQHPPMRKGRARIRPLGCDYTGVEIPRPSAHARILAQRVAQRLPWWARYAQTIDSYAP